MAAKLPPLVQNTPPFQTDSSLSWSLNYKSTYQRAFKPPRHDLFLKEFAESKRVKLNVLKQVQAQSSVICDDPLLKTCHTNKKKLKPLYKHQHPAVENTSLLIPSSSTGL
jgi:hypothetical protein